MTDHAATAAPRGDQRSTRRRRLVDAVDERMGIKALCYPVPEHANNLAWSLGALTAISFVILLATGVYIAQWYNRMPELANQSVRTLVTEVWGVPSCAGSTSGPLSRCSSSRCCT